jgi:hypothetical protein
MIIESYEINFDVDNNKDSYKGTCTVKLPSGYKTAINQTNIIIFLFLTFHHNSLTIIG